MKIITVIPFEKGPFKENLSYFSSKNIPFGSIVSISLRNKKILGLVVSCQEVVDIKSDIKKMFFNLKKINEIKKNTFFQKEFLESALEIGKYFAANENYSITSLIPSVFRDNYDQVIKFSKEGKIIEENKKDDKNLKTEKLLFQAPFLDRISFYKTLIRSSFASKKSIFVVLPTEKDIQKYYELLSKGIEKFSFCLHGGLSVKEVLEKIKKIIGSTHPVLIFATAPFLSIPRKDLKTIILEHESSKSYKMISKPYFDLRFFVEVFATRMKIKLILGDSLLRFETIKRKDVESFNEVHPLSFRTKFNGELEILGKNSAEEIGENQNSIKKEFKILSEKSILEIRKTLAEKSNVFIFSLRKGLATMTVCRDCSEPLLCKDCLAPLVLYLSKNAEKRMFVCNRCKKEITGDTSCNNCNSWNLIPLGIGTDTVLAEIKNIFPGIKTFKLDKESVKTKKGAEKIIKEFESSNGSILIATELGLFYLKEKAPLTIVASFDSLWSIPNFQVNEKIIQLLLDIIQNTKQKIIIQTKNERDPALLAIKNENLLPFIREELKDRKELDYPPYRRFIKIKHLGSKEDSIWARQILSDSFKEYNTEIFSGFVPKLKGKYVTNALLRLELKDWSLPTISFNSRIDQNLLEKALALPNSFEISVDPEDLL